VNKIIEIQRVNKMSNSLSVFDVVVTTTTTSSRFEKKNQLLIYYGNFFVFSMNNVSRLSVCSFLDISHKHIILLSLKKIVFRFATLLSY
jgi:hypothetical protein